MRHQQVRPATQEVRLELGAGEAGGRFHGRSKKKEAPRRRNQDREEGGARGRGQLAALVEEGGGASRERCGNELGDGDRAWGFWRR